MASPQHGAAGQGCRRTRGPVGGCASSLPPRPSPRSLLTALACTAHRKASRLDFPPSLALCSAAVVPARVFSTGMTAQYSRLLASRRRRRSRTPTRDSPPLRPNPPFHLRPSRATQSSKDEQRADLRSLSPQARASLSTSSPPRPTSPRAAPAGTTPATPSSPTSTASRPSSTFTSFPRVRLCVLDSRARRVEGNLSRPRYVASVDVAR